MLTKGSEWTYEKEYRLFDLDFDDVPYKLYKFKKEALKKVIFGIRTPDPIIKETINIVQREYLQKGYSVELYRMMVLDKKYAVVPKKI